MSGYIEDYEVLNVIGTGSFGTCYKVQKKSNGSLYVWKAVGYGGMSEEKKQLLVSEVNLLSELRHPNIVQYFDRIIHKETATLYIIMEWCKGGDLATLINKCKKSGSFLDEGFIWRVLYQMCRALQACHWHLSVTILHRDIKPANVFLDGAGNVKLGDFGLARILHDDTSFAQTLVGTPYYMSPEVIKGGKYNKKSDIWSLGCLVYELCSMSPPFSGQNIKHLALKIKEGKFSRIPVHYSDDLQKIISLLLSVEPNLRPTAESILQHPLVVTHIAGETFKTMTSKPVHGTTELHSGSQKEVNDIPNVVQNLHDLHLPASCKAAFQDETECKNCKGSNNANIRDIWLNRFHMLKQREASLRLKELAIHERERAIARKEKRVTLLDRLTKEKMMRADIYLRQCRETRSATSSVKNLQQQRYNTANADLDTSLSADPGDTSVVPTSTKLNPEYVTKPSPFVRVNSERRVHFNTLPVTKPKAKYSDLQPAAKQAVPRFINPSGKLSGPFTVSTKAVCDIQEHVPSKVSEVYEIKGELQERIKNSFHDLERSEKDNFRNDVLTVLHSNKCASRSNNVIVKPPPCTTTWMEDQTLWLENKRHSYVLGIMRAQRSANKENAEPQRQRVTKSVGMSTVNVSSAPKSAVTSYSSFR